MREECQSVGSKELCGKLGNIWAIRQCVTREAEYGM
jgi:hypothetical protein